MAMDMVSVIMPVYNSGRFIEDSILSVISQTYSCWELIVVDDGSTDNSKDIVEQYVKKDSRIHLLQNYKPLGIPAIPRNIGIQQAKGRFIAFLDSDDIWFPTKLEQQVRLFNHKKTAIVFSNYEKMNEEGLWAGRIIKAPDTASYECLLKGNVIGNLTGIYDVAKVGKVLFRPIHHEDYALWLSILKKGFIARNTNTVTALYRVRKASVSSRKLAVLSWQWNIYMNVEKIGIIKSAYYYINYACRALHKKLI